MKKIIKQIVVTMMCCLFFAACQGKLDDAGTDPAAKQPDVTEEIIILRNDPPPEKDESIAVIAPAETERADEPIETERTDESADDQTDDPADEPPVKKETTFAFAGDVLLDGYVKANITAGGYDAIFSPDLTGYFVDADMAMVNMEFPFSERGTPEDDKQYTFRAEPKDVQFLLNIGIDAVSLGNNHVLDYGRDALEDTFTVLTQAGLVYAGAGRNADEAKEVKILDINGKRVGIICPSRVIPFVSWYAGKNTSGVFGTYDPVPVYEEIEKARDLVDYLIVYVHWGVERTYKLERYQETMARGYIDSGADIVIGSHPHVLQGIDYYKDKPIVYSLGNFIFNDTKKDTAILLVTLSEEGESRLSIVPCRITKRLTAEIQDTKEREDLRKLLNDISFNAVVDDQFQVYPLE